MHYSFFMRTFHSPEETILEGKNFCTCSNFAISLLNLSERYKCWTPWNLSPAGSLLNTINTEHFARSIG